jgi:ethanolamine ammonia-lyase small subunit
MAALPENGPPCDVLFVVGDGLAATAVQSEATTLIRACAAELGDLTLGSIVIAKQARVALGDPIGERLKARVCVMIVGERPGLTVAASLGIYMTFAPRAGRRDSERNCISNIHVHGGLSCASAARSLAWLVREALRRQLSGVELKDDQAPELYGQAAAQGRLGDGSAGPSTGSG